LQVQVSIQENVQNAGISCSICKWKYSGFGLPGIAEMMCYGEWQRVTIL